MPTALQLTSEKALIFRITHAANVPWLLRHGVPCSGAAEKDPNFVRIGNPELIDRRKGRAVPIAPGGTLHHYVPFYFTPHSPMMYNIKTGHRVEQQRNSDLVVLVSSLPLLSELNVASCLPIVTPTSRLHGSRVILVAWEWSIGPPSQGARFRRDPEDPGKFERYKPRPWFTNACRRPL